MNLTNNALVKGTAVGLSVFTLTSPAGYPKIQNKIHPQRKAPAIYSFNRLIPQYGFSIFDTSDVSLNLNPAIERRSISFKIKTPQPKKLYPFENYNEEYWG